MGFATDAIHVGQEPDPSTGAVVAPIYQTSTYVLEEMGKNKGYDYARTAHPNRRPLNGPWPNWRAAARRMCSPPAWPRSTPFSGSCVRATTPSFPKRSTVAPSAGDAG